jgi:hypothetical protein
LKQIRFLVLSAIWKNWFVFFFFFFFEDARDALALEALPIGRLWWEGTRGKTGAAALGA